MQTSSELVPAKPSTEPKLQQLGGIVGLAVSVDELKKRYAQFKELKKELLTDADYYKIKTKDGEVNAIRKSGWFTFATAFNLSIEILQEEEVINDDKELVEDKHLIRYKFTVRCFAPNGRYGDEVGTCDNQEKYSDGSKKHDTAHKIRAMAKTRATERAIIYMVGANERAAEDYEEFDDKPKTTSNGTVCHCKFDEMKPDKGIDQHCGKPLTIGQLETLKKMGKVQ